MNSTTANLVKAPARRVDRSLFSIKLMLPAILAVLIIHSDTRTVVVSALADAYYQVSVFVAATLYLYHQLSKRFNQFELGYLALQNPTLEIVVAAILGILPGCGGAIVVVTQYTKNQASFGAVVAVLVATMGDAAFLLLAQQPLTAFSIMTIGLITGVLSGFVANKVLPTQQYSASLEIDFPLAISTPQYLQSIAGRFWQWTLFPALAIALLSALNWEFGTFKPYIDLVGVACCFAISLLWAITPANSEAYREVPSHDSTTKHFALISKDTHFISVIVLSSFIAFAFLENLTQFDFKQWFTAHGIFAPLLGAIIGLIPGCGPQIILTSMYLQGLLPFSALAANAISNDGDALFPAIALAPKAAILASILTFIPSLVVGYVSYGVFGI